MAYFLRSPSPYVMGRYERSRACVSSYRTADGELRFIHAAPLVAHDRCTDEHDAGGHPWDPGRAAFGELAGSGWDWCWAPLYSDNPETAPPCYFCRERVVGVG